jgi:uncharacterized integral membrane protein
MRLLLGFLIGVVTAAAIAGLGILVAQNTQHERLIFLGITSEVQQGLVVAGAAVWGFLIAFLLLAPGRLVSAQRGWQLGRQAKLQEAHLRALSEDYAQLRGGHQRLVEEHQRVMDQVLTPIVIGNGRTPATAPPTVSQSSGPAASADAENGHLASGTVS